MKVRELIASLQTMNPKHEVLFYEDIQGSWVPNPVQVVKTAQVYTGTHEGVVAYAEDQSIATPTPMPVVVLATTDVWAAIGERRRARELAERLAVSRASSADHFFEDGS